MCIDFPGRVVSRGPDHVMVETDGRRRLASTLIVPDLKVGDWVYVAAGTVIERLEPDVAQQINEQVAAAKGVSL